MGGALGVARQSPLQEKRPRQQPRRSCPPDASHTLSAPSCWDAGMPGTVNTAGVSDDDDDDTSLPVLLYTRANSGATLEPLVRRYRDDAASLRQRALAEECGSMSCASRSSIVVINLDTGARENADEVFLNGDENTTSCPLTVNCRNTASSKRMDHCGMKGNTTARHWRDEDASIVPAQLPDVYSITPRAALPLTSAQPRLPCVLPLPLAFSRPPRLSIADIETLVGPLEEYEYRFGELYDTGVSPFVVEQHRMRGTVVHPFPQPDFTQPRQLSSRRRTGAKLVGAVYVARRVQSPDWRSVRALGSMKKSLATHTREVVQQITCEEGAWV